LAAQRAPVPITFHQAFSVLQTAKETNPYSGSNATKSESWKKIHSRFLEVGGDEAYSVDWLKKKMNEFVNFHKVCSASLLFAHLLLSHITAKTSSFSHKTGPRHHARW
jgi:hypothetical protein